MSMYSGYETKVTKSYYRLYELETEMTRTCSVIPSSEPFFRSILGLASLRVQPSSVGSVDFLVGSVDFLLLYVVFSTFILFLMLSFLTWCRSLWPHARPVAYLNFCHFQFLHMGASHWHCLHPLKYSCLNETCGGILVSHRTPDIFLQLFHPSALCHLVYFCIHVTIDLQVASQLFEFGNLWQLGRLLHNTS